MEKDLNKRKIKREKDITTRKKERQGALRKTFPVVPYLRRCSDRGELAPALAPARPAPPALPRLREDKEAPHRELLSLLPQFPLSLSLSLFRESTEPPKP